MRFSPGVVSTVMSVGILYATASHADHQPVIAVPGNPTMPVIVEGQDVSWAVIEGDWGLHRAGHGTPTFYYRYLPGAEPGAPRAYFPFTGKRPRTGRLEIIPPENRRLPPPAESYFRYWGTDGTNVPAQTDYPVVPPPSVIVAPHIHGRY